MEDIIKLITNPDLVQALTDVAIAFTALVAATNGLILVLRVVAKLTPWSWDDKTVDAVYKVTRKLAEVLTFARKK